MVVSSDGDIGDSIILMGIIKGIPGGPHDLIFRKSTVTKMRTAEDVAKWHHLAQPLFEGQPYIQECRVANDNERADWDSGGFRGSGLHSKTATLFSAQLSHLIAVKKIGHGLSSKEPWLSVSPSGSTKGRVVIARSGRYRNGSFPWQKVVDFYGDRLIFVGLTHEWAEFSGHFGMVEYLPTKDLLEVAQAISGSLLFIGNQSSPMTVCEGLKHRSIQETSTNPADCIYKRDNAQYCYDGKMTLPGFDGKEDLVIKPPGLNPDKISTMTAPPGYWQYPGCAGRPTFESAMEIIKGLPQYKGIPQDELRREVIRHNVERVPDFFASPNSYGVALRAMQEAGYDV